MGQLEKAQHAVITSLSIDWLAFIVYLVSNVRLNVILRNEVEWLRSSHFCVRDLLTFLWLIKGVVYSEF